MRVIECKALPQKPLYFYGDKLWGGSDNFIASNSIDKSIDYLVFMDSRGLTGELSCSLVGKIITEITGLDKTYLVIVRPLELTTWATLLNFYVLNDLTFKNLITNMGFVDFTPKKKSICDDSIKQLERCVGNGEAVAVGIERYGSLDNRDIELYSIEYSEKYRLMVQDIVSKQRTIIINTPQVPKDIKIERARPKSFFSAILEGNSFNLALADTIMIEADGFDESHTFDAVHYTVIGAEKIMKLLRKFL